MHSFYPRYPQDPRSSAFYLSHRHNRRTWHNRSRRNARSPGTPEIRLKSDPPEFKQCNMPWFETITDLSASAATIRRRRYGVIEVVDGKLAGIHLRPFPRIMLWAEAWWRRQTRASRKHGDRCRLYYAQPLWHSNYLAVNYVESTPGTSFSSLRLATVILDHIARLKRSDAVFCDVTNAKISDRLLHRWGWAPLRVSRWHRVFIKRFYGKYPELPEIDRSGPARDKTMTPAMQRCTLMACPRSHRR